MRVRLLPLALLFLTPVLVAAGAPSDADGDGLADGTELAIGTDSMSVDSDCDGLDDAREVATATPRDTEGDGLIDALESAVRDSDLDGSVDEADSETAGQARIACARFHPLAVALDGSEAARVEVRVMGSGVTAVALASQFPVVGLTVDGVEFAQSGGTVLLYDDGSHGDRLADDGIWTRGAIRSEAPPLPPARLVSFDLLTVTDSLSTRTINLYQTAAGGSAGAARLGQLDPALRRDTAPLAGKFRASSHAAFLVDAMAEAEARRYLMLRPPVADVRLIAQAFYAVLPDAYDFLLVEPASPAIRGLAGAHTPVRNAVGGIGQAPLDHGAAWGSGARLQSAVFFNFTDRGPFIHELVHRWGNALDAGLGFGHCTPGHWGLAGAGYGALGGYDPDTLVDHGDGNFSVQLDSFSLGGPSTDVAPMNALELYLAGFTSVAETPPLQVPVNPDCASIEYDGAANRARFAADAVVARSIADIVGVHGPRTPSSSSAQRHFTAAWLVPIDHVPNATEAGWFDYQARYLGLATGTLPYRLSFEQAAAGLATLETGLFTVFTDSFE